MDRQKLREKISKNIVSYELPHMTKTIDEIMTYIDDYVNEQLALCNVVVPKGTLCDCDKPNRYYCLKTGGDRCKKCKKLL